MSDISLAIDDKACVGCSLCVDVCPTKVFEIGAGDTLPKVAHVKECFGCQSCTEICPATAIGHTGLQLSQSYHHDRSALAFAARLGAPPRQINAPDSEKMIGEAMRDLGVRLLSVAAVLKQSLGSSLPAVGTMAGMSLAVQMPHYQAVTSFEEACAWVKKTFAPAWELSFSKDGDKLIVNVDACFVRSLCTREKLPLGGDLCVLFYNYLAGYLSKVSGKRPRLTNSAPGEKRCTYSVTLHG